MKILMVCLGNICRSPIAEGVMKQKIQEKKLPWLVESRGTSSFHNGELPHEDSIAITAQHGIDIKDQMSQLLIRKDIEQFDKILAMDASNYNNILDLCLDNEKPKVELLLNYSFPNQNRAVPDPYYVGGFDIVYEMIDKACDAFIEKHSS